MMTIDRDNKPELLTVLGTGHAMSVNYYNTCFTISDQDQHFLVDAGGGNGILRQLQDAGIKDEQIHHMFVTHAHTDHIMGSVWILRKVTALMYKELYDGEFHVYCQASLEPIIRGFCTATMQKRFTDYFDRRIFFHIIKDGTQFEILGRKITFFDICSTKSEQHGFRMCLKNKKILVCLGDEPYNVKCKEYVKDADWILSEALCMYEDRDRFHPYQKHHSTVKDACTAAQELRIPNLVLWHTEDTHKENRKELYSEEGKQYYSGNLFVPEDLEVLEL